MSGRAVGIALVLSVLATSPSAAAAGLDEEVAAAVAKMRTATEGGAGARLGRVLTAARALLERVQELVARRRLAEARDLLPELRTRVEAVVSAKRALELEDRARSLEVDALRSDEDARVAKDAYERALVVRRELEARP